MLYVFSGLPGTGKSTLTRALARHVGAVHLRIDCIEQALRVLPGTAANPDAGDAIGDAGIVIDSAARTESQSLHLLLDSLAMLGHGRLLTPHTAPSFAPASRGEPS